MTENALRRTSHGELLVLELVRGSAHTIDSSLLREILAAVGEAAADPPRGLVLSGQGKVFSAGLDLFALESLDREGMAELLALLRESLRGLFAFPRPVVAALNGHAIAGGLLLALACDLRLLARGNARLGLNECTLGLSLPAHAMEIVRYALPRAAAERLIHEGALHAGEEAVGLGVVDELVDAHRLIERAEERVRQWTPSLEAFAANKARLKSEALAALDAARAHDELWLDLWFRDETRRNLDAARARLRESRR